MTLSDSCGIHYFVINMRSPSHYQFIIIIFHLLCSTAMEGFGASSKSRPAPLRYLGRMSQPDPVSDPFELQESDVIWATNSTDLDYSDNSPHTPTSPAPNPNPNPSLVRNRPVINPTLSAISAAKAIPHIHHHSPPGQRSLNGSGPRTTQMSAPVNVPVWPKKKEAGSGSSRQSGDEDDYGYEKMMPPHEIVARSHTATAFSVFEGAGRTLKGRDLRRVRNAVFRKTGFLD